MRFFETRGQPTNKVCRLKNRHLAPCLSQVIGCRQAAQPGVAKESDWRECGRDGPEDFAGCQPGEIAIDRNTTEAMNSIIFGLPLKAGDEIILTKQDYPNVINSWKLREKRDGVILKWINLELPTEDEDYLVKAYTDSFTDKTKAVNITHIINWIGQIMPVKQISGTSCGRTL